ncbi:hypothetical protein BX600DRAFT_552864 [Xylariales sp. PMI_506]|nr:hypothetical protein BX600DRAFT_552864 [Xylariales sp. PMI_506]
MASDSRPSARSPVASTATELEPRFTFVTTDDHGKHSHGDMRRIRSHVLRGRTKSRANRTRRLEAALPPSARSQVFCFEVSHASVHSGPPKKARNRDGAESEDDNRAVAAIPVAAASPLVSVPGAPFYISCLAIDVDQHSFGILHDYHPTALESFSLREFGFRRDLKSSQWTGWLLSNVAYAQSAMSVAYAFQDLHLGRTPSKGKVYYYARAVAQLNERLSDADLTIDDSTVATIISLAIVSALSEDYAAVAAHAAGLRKIIQLRGGLQSFRDCPHLIVGISRVDLHLSLGLGHQGAITTVPFPLTGAFSPSPNNFYGRPPPSIRHDRDLHGLVDNRVASIFDDLQKLARQVNDATSGGPAIPESVLHEGLLSAQYALLRLDSALDTILSECVRMTLLGVLASLPTARGSRLRYDHAAGRLRELCRAVQILSDSSGASSSVELHRLRELMLWVLMMGLIASMLKPDEEWLRDRWQRELAVLTHEEQWPVVRSHLQAFIWINVSHERPGKQCFEELIRSSE